MTDDPRTPTNRTQAMALAGMASLVAGLVSAVYFLWTGRQLSQEQQAAVGTIVLALFTLGGVLANWSSILAKKAGQRAAQVVDTKVNVLVPGAERLDAVAEAVVKAEEKAG